MSSTDAPISDAALARAYAETRKPDWPSLEILQLHYRQFATIRGRARAMEQGVASPAAASDATTAPRPACPGKRGQDPQNCWAVRCQLGKRCKNADAAAQMPPTLDHKRLAAGERDDD